MKLLLTVDVEPDYTTGTVNPYEHLSTDFKRFLLFLREEGVPAVLFICGIVARNFRDLLQKYIDSFEVGVHTHPEYHPEYKEGLKRLNMYPPEEQFQMIKRDYDIIYKNLNIKPIAFRAGKLAADDITISLLKYLQIKIDSSLLVPYIFSLDAIKHKPWRIKEQNGIIRIPVIAADNRIIDGSFRIKANFIKFLDRTAVCCIMFHSWWVNESKLTSALNTLFNKFEFVKLKDVLNGD
jgi:hypothetical protein